MTISASPRMMRVDASLIMPVTHLCGFTRGPPICSIFLIRIAFRVFGGCLSGGVATRGRCAMGRCIAEMSNMMMMENGPGEEKRGLGLGNTGLLEEWLKLNSGNLYPSKAQKDALVAQSGLSYSQVWAAPISRKGKSPLGCCGGVWGHGNAR